MPGAGLPRPEPNELQNRCIAIELIAKFLALLPFLLRQLARDCLNLANTVPAKDRQALLEMASEWERIADQQQWASDLGQQQQLRPKRTKST